MVYGILKFINFAHGDVLMVGAYVGLFLLTCSGFFPAWLVDDHCILYSHDHQHGIQCTAGNVH